MLVRSQASASVALRLSESVDFKLPSETLTFLKTVFRFWRHPRFFFFFNFTMSISNPLASKRKYDDDNAIRYFKSLW